METKILYACIGISVIAGLFLGFYIMIYKPACERHHVDEIYRDMRSIDEVNSEEGAAEIAAACLNIAYDYESQETPDYDVEVIFNELSYEWIVIFTPKDPEQDGTKMAAIRRDFGTVNVLSETEYDH